MRNYFKALGIPTVADRDQVKDSLQSTSQSTEDLMRAYHLDIHAVMLNEDRRQMYASTAQLYEALHGASSCLTSSVGTDTHRWRERVSDFDSNVDHLDAPNS